jgi:amino acid permease
MRIRNIVKFIPGFIWWAITFWLFTLPGSAIPKFDLFHELQGDKLVHAFLFIVLSLLFYTHFYYSFNIKKISYL